MALWIRGNTHRKFSLKRAYALSCNGYYASVAVNHLGLGIITQYAQRLRFGASPPADFYIPPSPLTPPTAANVSAHTVGEYARGVRTGRYQCFARPRGYTSSSPAVASCGG